jgi:hypothetical protein
MTHAGRATQVQFVLIATVIYHMMALDLPKWAIKATDKIRCGFLWRERKEANGGHCMVAWGKVTCTKELGGLGISDIQCLNRALRVRWIWLQKTDSSRPWADLPIQSNWFLDKLCSLAMACMVGDGQSTLFWHDKWLMGQRIADLGPQVFSLVPKRLVKRRTMADALCSSSWLGDLRGVVMWEVIADFIILADAITDVALQLGAPNKHYWRFSSNGLYSAKSAYELMLCGSTSLAGFERMWCTWRRLSVISSSGWSYITSVGRLTGSLRMFFPILVIALYVTRKGVYSSLACFMCSCKTILVSPSSTSRPGRPFPSAR